MTSPEQPSDRDGSMRASVLHGTGDLRLEQRPVPRPGDGELLVRVRSVGVCGSDTHYYEHGRIGPYVVESPLVLGHEPSGEVVAAGPGAPSELVGRRVSLEPGVPRAWSAETLAGDYHLDPDVRFFATPPVDGVFCEYVAHPAAFCHPVPDERSFDAAALLEPLSVAIAAVRAAQVRLGDHVLVTGAGPVGLLVARCAALSGATRVAVVGSRADRLDVARSWGATSTWTPQRADTPEPAFDVLVDASGAEPWRPTAVRGTGPRWSSATPA